MKSKPVIGISLGDPCGIGPEVVCQALQNPRVKRALVPLVFGDPALLPGLSLAPWAPAQGRPLRPSLCAVSQLSAKDRRPGKPTSAGGRAQLAYVHAAIEAAQQGLVEGLCTAPVSKEQISRAGVPFMGHTEVLAEAFGAQVLMLMDGPRVKVALATNHLPLADVPAALTTPLLVSQLKLLSKALVPLLGHKPRLAVCGLNPHAGEGGLLGKEELTVIGPAVKAARRAGVDCHGPLPADGLFAQVGHHGKLSYDAVLVMFHDQGLVVAKALDFERTVNVTLGLTVPRTSPDHGVAYDLAGTGKASAVPMVEALLKACALTFRR